MKHIRMINEVRQELDNFAIFSMVSSSQETCFFVRIQDRFSKETLEPIIEKALRNFVYTFVLSHTYDWGTHEYIIQVKGKR